MRVFVYEFLTARGIGRDPDSPEHSLYREGAAMLQVLTDDLRQIASVHVVSLPEDVLATETDWIAAAVTDSDGQILIAPEFDGILERLVRQVESLGGHVLGPSADAVALTADKQRLAEHWREHGVPTPATSEREPSVCEIFPLVWKPRDGAGSTATFLLECSTDVARCRALRQAEGHTGAMIMQEYVKGRAASIAFLAGPGGLIPLCPTWQRLSTEGRFRYDGGELPIPEPLAERAISLGRQALACLEGFRGWVGVDLILGDHESGSSDFALEINPRLTTSYIGLRARAESNLAEQWLRAASGVEVELRWKPLRVQFGSGGSVRVDPV